MNMIEKLEIKPIESHAVRNGFICDALEVRILEQQRNELLEALIKDIDLLETIMEHTYGDACIESEILNRIEIIQKIAPNKSLTDIEIKELI